MPELQVIHEFKRRCLVNIEDLHITCQLYFNPKSFRKGGKTPLEISKPKAQPQAKAHWSQQEAKKGRRRILSVVKQGHPSKRKGIKANTEISKLLKVSEKHKKTKDVKFKWW